VTILLAPPVLEVKTISPRVFPRYHRAKYRNPIGKGLHFLRHEGPTLTLRKFHSKLIERSIEQDQCVVIASIVRGPHRFVGFTRSLGGPYNFHPDLIFAITDHYGLDNIALSGRALTLLESYLPVPSCPLPPDLPRVLLELNPFLKPIDDPLMTAHLRAFHSPRCPGPRESRARLPEHPRVRGSRRVYCVGFGSYIREYVLDHFKRYVAAAVDYRAALIGKHIAPSFPVYPTLDDVLPDIARDDRPLVIIATYHSDHAPMTFDVLDANPSARVFIEKPVAVHLADVRKLIEYRRRGAWIDVGYNRRYAPLSGLALRELRTLPRPLVITTSVKEIKIPETHWYRWPNQGTRITGNVCHWIDLLWYWLRQRPVELALLNTEESVCLSLLLEGGALANITATDRGDDLEGVSEQIDVLGGDTTLTLRNFQELVIRSQGHRRRIGRVRRDKGHLAMYRDLKRRWLADLPAAYDSDSLYWVAWMTAAAAAMLQSGERHRNVSPTDDVGVGR